MRVGLLAWTALLAGTALANEVTLVRSLRSVVAMKEMNVN